MAHEVQLESKPNWFVGTAPGPSVLTDHSSHSVRSIETITLNELDEQASAVTAASIRIPSIEDIVFQDQEAADMVTLQMERERRASHQHCHVRGIILL